MLNPCSLCDANCCKSFTITVTSFDISRILKNTQRNPNEFVVFHEPRLLSYDPDLVLDFADSNYGGLLGLKSHPCIFLKNNRCTIHKFAPLSCRRYPYQTNESMNARFCPLPSQFLFKLKGADISSDQLICELLEYKKIVKEWNKNKGKKEDCLDFLLAKTLLKQLFTYYLSMRI